jgi:hypothetical protein
MQDNTYRIVWKTLFLIGSVVAAGWAVDGRYVSNTVFATFKEGTIAAIFERLDKLDSKADRIDDKLDRLLEQVKK